MFVCDRIFYQDFLKFFFQAKKLHEERIKIDRRRRPLEIRIKEYIVGQNYAISTVCAGLLISKKNKN